MWRAPEGPEGTARPASALGLAAVPVGVTPIRVENVYSFGWKMYNALHIRGSQEIQKQAARFELLAVMPWVAAGPGCGARGRLRGLAGHLCDPFKPQARSHLLSRSGHRPRVCYATAGHRVSDTG